MGFEAEAMAMDMGGCLCLEESHLVSVQSQRVSYRVSLLGFKTAGFC